MTILSIETFLNILKQYFYIWIQTICYQSFDIFVSVMEINYNLWSKWDYIRIRNPIDIGLVGQCTSYILCLDINEISLVFINFCYELLISLRF